MSYLHPLDWFNSLPESFDDATSFRHMRHMAQDNIDKLDGIRTEIVEKHGEQAAIDEWDDIMKGDTDRYREAVRLIDERLAQLGFTL